MGNLELFAIGYQELLAIFSILNPKYILTFHEFLLTIP